MEHKLLPPEDGRILTQLIEQLSVEYPHILSTFDKNNLSLAEVLKTVFSYYEHIIACMPGIIYWFDNNCRAVGCNANELRMFGFDSISQFKGLTFERIGEINQWSSEVTRKFQSDTEEVLKTGEAKLDIEEPPIYDEQGNPKYFLSSRVPVFDLNNHVLAVVGISIDITERKLAEEALKIAKEKAEQANELKTKFIQNMQHDIRTPLAGIFQYMETWAESETDPEKKYCADLMRASSGQLLNMCNEIVDFENIDYMGDEIHLSVIDTPKFLSRIIDLNKMAAHGRGLDINIDIDPNVPARLKLDKQKLYRVLVNLMGNSLKFTEKGSVSLHVKFIAKDATTNTIAFEVHDTGAGIPADKIDLIFDKFVRLTPANQTKYKGTGLGLYYVKKFVTDMGGQLKVESEVGKGSVFRVTLTLPIPAADEMPIENQHEIDTYTDTISKEILKLSPIETTAPEATETSTYTGDKIDVLIIEDDHILQKTITTALHRNHCQVVATADTVKTACEALQARKYDLVICDLGLPDGTGIDVMKWIKQDKAHPNQNTPFVVLTANADGNTKNNAVASGFLDVFQKPLSDVTVQQIMQRYIDTQEPCAVSAADDTVIDIHASVAVAGDLTVVKEVFHMLSDALIQDKQDLRQCYEKNDIETTRQILHRLDGSLRYCIVPKLQLARTALHDAVHDVTQLNTITPLFDAFYQEIDRYLATFERLKGTGML